MLETASKWRSEVSPSGNCSSKSRSGRPSTGQLSLMRSSEFWTCAGLSVPEAFGWIHCVSELMEGKEASGRDGKKRTPNVERLTPNVQLGKGSAQRPLSRHWAFDVCFPPGGQPNQRDT